MGETIYDAFIKSKYVEDVAEVCRRVACIVGYDNVEHLLYDQLDYLMNELHVVG